MRHTTPATFVRTTSALSCRGSFGHILAAQTKVTAPENEYSPKQDVELGREAADQARKQLPIMRDEVVTSYVEDLGRRLVTGIPQRVRAPRVPLRLRHGQRARHQRLRAAGRSRCSSTAG